MASLNIPEIEQPQIFFWCTHLQTDTSMNIKYSQAAMNTFPTIPYFIPKTHKCWETILAIQSQQDATVLGHSPV